MPVDKTDIVERPAILEMEKHVRRQQEGADHLPLEYRVRAQCVEAEIEAKVGEPTLDRPGTLSRSLEEISGKGQRVGMAGDVVSEIFAPNRQRVREHSVAKAVHSVRVWFAGEQLVKQPVPRTRTLPQS